MNKQRVTVTIEADDGTEDETLTMRFNVAGVSNYDAMRTGLDMAAKRLGFGVNTQPSVSRDVHYPRTPVPDAFSPIPRVNY